MRTVPLRVAVLVSGRGTNMAAIARACSERRIDATVAAVIADRPEAPAIGLAQSMGLKTAIVPFRDLPNGMCFETALAATLGSHQPDLIALAGFMRILSADFVAAWTGRMLNVHPSLLPRHRGLHTHRRVLEAGEHEHGASVHYVTHELDNGPVVLQSRILVRAGDTAAALSARVQATEHIIYPRVIGWIGGGRLAWRDGSAMLDGRALAAPIVEDFD
jgi:phosphoribosylglycinamide formyltransferase 1